MADTDAEGESRNAIIDILLVTLCIYATSECIVLICHVSPIQGIFILMIITTKHITPSTQHIIIIKLGLIAVTRVRRYSVFLTINSRK